MPAGSVSELVNGHDSPGSGAMYQLRVGLLQAERLHWYHLPFLGLFVGLSLRHPSSLSASGSGVAVEDHVSGRWF